MPELDFRAIKKVYEYKRPSGGVIVFGLDLIGECKRSSTHDFFAFQAEQIEDTLALSAFPLCFHRESIFALPFSCILGSLKRHFNFDFVTDRIVEVNSVDYDSRKGDNYNDKVTHSACETLLLACGHYKKMAEKLNDLYMQHAWGMIMRRI